MDAKDQREADDHIAAKYIKASSQQDVIKGKVSEPGMYRHTYDPGELFMIANEPAVWVVQHSSNSISYEFQHIPNKQAVRIVNNVLPKVLELWLKKSKDYGGNLMEDLKLGPKACIPDIMRKVGKLKRAIWDEQEMVGEQPDEILMDLIGHILIILDERTKDA